MKKPKNYDKHLNFIMKTKESNRTLRVRVKVRFLLFCFKIAPNDP